MIIRDTEDLGGLFLCSLAFTTDVVSGWSVKQRGLSHMPRHTKWMFFLGLGD